MATEKPYRAERGVPPMPDEGAPGPLTEEQRMAPMKIGKASDLTAEERRKFSRMPADSVKKAKGGSASSRADGCAQRGKTRGKMV